MLLPGFRDRRCRRIAHLGTGPIGNGREVANRFLNRLAAGRGIHFQPGGNIEEQTARPAPSGQKLRIRLGVTRPGDRIDLGHRGYKIVTGKPLEQGFAPLIERQCVFFKNKLGHVTQQKCGNVEIAQTPQPGLLVGSFSVLDEVGDQRLGQLGGVILRCGFERMEQRCHGCCSARLLKGGNRGWLSSTCNPRQPLQARGRNALWRRRSQIERANGFEPVEVEEKFTGRPLSWHGSQTVQRGEPGLAVFIEQLRNALALFLVESGNKTFPKALLRPVADASDKALQNAHARQHHLVHDQPRRSPLDQGTGVIVATPAQRVKPSGQAKPGRSIVSKLGKAITLSDQGEMPNALAIFMIEITLEAWRGLQAELADQESRYGTGNSKLNTGEDAEEPGRSQHKREAEAIVVATQSVGDLPVGSVQMEIPGQLIRRRISGKTGIALPLLIGQVAGGHIVRNLALLRRVNGARKRQAISLAKYLCGSRHFSNRFCEARGAFA